MFVKPAWSSKSAWPGPPVPAPPAAADPSRGRSARVVNQRSGGLRPRLCRQLSARKHRLAFGRQAIGYLKAVEATPRRPPRPGRRTRDCNPLPPAPAAWAPAPCATSTVRQRARLESVSLLSGSSANPSAPHCRTSASGAKVLDQRYGDPVDQKGQFAVVEIGRNRQISREATGPVADTAGPALGHRPAHVLMDRDGQDPGIAVEGRLNAVAVMGVDIQIGDPRQPAVEQRQNPQHRVVEIAEPAGVVRPPVMGAAGGAVDDAAPGQSFGRSVAARPGLTRRRRWPGGDRSPDRSGCRCGRDCSVAVRHGLRCC